jgi:SAM-dependent methyltransferase
VLGDAIRDSGARAESELEREFERRDPWGYETARGARRFARELDLIDRVAGRGALDAVLEVGCAEGHFTQQLAPRCHSLLAVDVNPVALQRARERCRAEPNVHFQQLDFRTDEVPGQFDLVVATSLLEYFTSRRALRRAREKLAEAVREGRWLLMGNVQQATLERAPWAQLLPRGAAPVNAFVAKHPDLHVVAETGGDDYLEMLLVKTGPR